MVSRLPTINNFESKSYRRVWRIETTSPKRERFRTFERRKDRVARTSGETNRAANGEKPRKNGKNRSDTRRRNWNETCIHARKRSLPMKRGFVYTRCRCSWTAGWNEIMLLFEQRIPVFAREIHHFQGKEKRARSNLLHFRWTVKEKKKRDLLPDQLSRFIRYIISDKPLPASRVSASDSWRSSLPEFRLKYALDGPSSPTSPPTRRVREFRGGGYGIYRYR